MGKIVIVLSCYQGSQYLPDLLASIRAQSCTDWTMLVRDDGSTDATTSLLREAAGDDARIEILETGGGRLGPYASFARLLQEAYDRGAEYVFLADQDDVWHVDKSARLMEAMDNGDARMAERPRLVYSDATVIDGDGKLLTTSFLRRNRLPYRNDSPRNKQLATLLGRSFVLGCACGVNRSLLSFALPIPTGVASHDWWLALAAASVGEIVLLDAPLFDYRRHQGNHSANSLAAALLFRPDRWKERWNRGWNSFCRSLDQVKMLALRLQRDGDGVGDDRDHLNASAATLQAYLDAIRGSRAPWSRVVCLLRLNLPSLDWRRRLLFYFCILLHGQHDPTDMPQ